METYINNLTKIVLMTVNIFKWPLFIYIGDVFTVFNAVFVISRASMDHL